MPKSAQKQHNHASSHSATPYSKKLSSSSASTSTAPPPQRNNIFRMNTGLGQHILKNPGVADAIIAKADLKQSDVVLEVGPGTGNLTVRILSHAKKCIAVEMDPRMAAELTKRVQERQHQARRLEIMLGDVIKLPQLPYFDVCISNTPYQISSPLVFKLLRAHPPPRVCVLMFQREFAMRLVANPGDKLYCRLSANVQMWADVKHVMKVGRANFNPPPQVESSVVRIIPKPNRRDNVNMDEWDGMLRICFGRKNKLLRASFFGQRGLIELLEANYRTYCAQAGLAIEDGEGEGDDEMDHQEMDADMHTNNDEMDIDVDMEDDEELPELFKKAKGRPRTKKRGGKVYHLVKEKVRKVLEDKTGLSEKRARLCDQVDFLKMLNAFHEEGIYFC